MNRFEMIGYLVNEPETRYTKDGNGITNFTIAVHYTKEESTFLKITAFGNTGKVVQEYSHKGDMLYVEGVIRNNNYTDKDGNKHYEYIFVGNKVEFLSKSTNNTKKKENPKKEPKNELNDKVFEDFGKSIEIDESELAF